MLQCGLLILLVQHVRAQTPQTPQTPQTLPTARPSADANADANATTLLFPLGTLGTARLLLGIGGSSVPAATGALYLSLSPETGRGDAMVVLLCVRAAGITAGVSSG